LSLSTLMLSIAGEVVGEAAARAVVTPPHSEALYRPCEKCKSYVELIVTQETRNKKLWCVRL